MLKENENNYIASVCGRAQGDGIGLSYCDISTGELCLTFLGRQAPDRLLINELVKISARELILDENTSECWIRKISRNPTGSYINP